MKIEKQQVKETNRLVEVYHEQQNDKEANITSETEYFM